MKTPKHTYSKPEIETIEIDNEVSLNLQSSLPNPLPSW